MYQKFKKKKIRLSNIFGHSGVVDIDPVFKISPKKKYGGFKSGEQGDHCGSHLRLISWSEKCWFNHANDSFEVCGVAPSYWNHWRTQTTSFRRPSSV